MLRFEVYKDGRPADQLTLQGAYLVASDGVAVRADISFKKGMIVCTKRTAGPAALALLWPVQGVGHIMQETTRLPERDRPYNLHAELVRGRLLRIAQKREDWGLYDFEGSEDISARVDKARDLLIEAFKADSGAEAARYGDDALREAVVAGEELAQFHAEIFLRRRVQSDALGRQTVGCVIDPDNTGEIYQKRFLEGFDFATLPVYWRDIEPKEQEFTWSKLDAWVDWLTKRQIPIKASPLVSFGERHLPDWLYIWEHDFETTRDLTYDHVRRVVKRYGHVVQQWNVVSGLHAENGFNFNFEQILEVTRMVAAITKQLAPRASTVIEIVSPWGEYYARNQRTIPPMLYADMVVQSGVNFDAFGISFFFGRSTEGMFARDMFQISSMIDRFSNLGKPLHVTAVQVPSAVPPPEVKDNKPLPANAARGGGSWHEPWSEEVQAKWLQHFYLIALSKPFVESVTWRDLVDPVRPAAGPGVGLTAGGLVKPDGTPKAGFRTLLKLRTELRRREGMELGLGP
jgi:endo-1,4-beta-xylanase